MYSTTGWYLKLNDSISIFVQMGNGRYLQVTGRPISKVLNKCSSIFDQMGSGYHLRVSGQPISKVLNTLKLNIPWTWPDGQCWASPNIALTGDLAGFASKA